VDENAPNATVLGTISASDPDAGDSLTFAITDGNTANAFAIDPATGQITVNDTHALDFETNPTFTLTVQATDTAGLTAAATVTVNLNDLAEDLDLAPQSFAVDENSAAGTVVGVVTATGPAAQNGVTYSITDGNTAGAFAIDAQSGQITVATPGVLDFEATPTFVLIVQAAVGQAMATAKITINLNDLNEPPTIADQTFTIAENALVATSPGTVAASDPDAGDSLTYSITAGNADGAFAINSATGTLWVMNTAALDAETSPTFTLTIQVTDSGGLTDSGTITVNLDDLNEPPTIANQTFTIDEDPTNGTLVGTVQASDPDAGDSLTYSITAGNTDGAFAINSTTGEITVSDPTPLDYETNPTFTLTVQVTSTDGRDASATVTVNLNNVNEAPSVADQDFSLDENAPNGTLVGTVQASDPDPDDDLTYSLESTVFTIDPATGEIRVAHTAALDFETAVAFTLAVQVTDSGGLSDTAIITITLEDLNEPPVIKPPFSFSVDENAPDGTIIGTITAEDPDYGDTLTFSIVEQTTYNSSFFCDVDPDTGDISVYGPPDFDFGTAMCVTVQVTDSHGLADVRDFLISINDASDGDPEFPTLDLEIGITNGPIAIAGQQANIAKWNKTSTPTDVEILADVAYEFYIESLDPGDPIPGTDYVNFWSDWLGGFAVFDVPGYRWQTASAVPSPGVHKFTGEYCSGSPYRGIGYAEGLFHVLGTPDIAAQGVSDEDEEDPLHRPKNPREQHPTRHHPLMPLRLPPQTRPHPKQQQDQRLRPLRQPPRLRWLRQRLRGQFRHQSRQCDPLGRGRRKQRHRSRHRPNTRLRHRTLRLPGQGHRPVHNRRSRPRYRLRQLRRH